MDLSNKQTVQFETGSPTEEKKFKLPSQYIIVGVLVFGIIGLGSGAFVLSNQQKKEPASSSVIVQDIQSSPPSPTFGITQDSISLTPSPLPTAIPTVAITPDPLATWSAYVSTRNGYSFRYPKDWTLKNTVQSDPKILEYIVLNPPGAALGALTITFTYTIRTYQEVLGTNTKNTSAIQVASISATKRVNQNSNGDISTEVILPYGSRTIIIYGKSTYQNIYDQVISSFVFLK